MTQNQNGPRRWRIVAPIVSVIVGLTLSSVAADAQPGKTDIQKAAELDLKAADAYDQDNFQVAQLIFQEAVRLDPRPKYIFNYAISAEKAGDCPAALAGYERYIAETKSDPSQSEKFLKTATEKAALLRPQCTAASDLFENEDNTDRTSETAAPETAINTKSRSASNVPIDPTSDSEPSSRNSYWVPLAVGSGVAAFAFGGYGIFKARKVSDIADRANAEAVRVMFLVPNVDPCKEESVVGFYPTLEKLCDDGNAAATQATVSFIAAGTFAVASGVFGYLAWRSGTEGEPQATVTPTVGVVGDVGVSGLVRF